MTEDPKVEGSRSQQRSVTDHPPLTAPKLSKTSVLELSCPPERSDRTLITSWTLDFRDFSLKDGKGWGHKRGDLKMPFSTWKNPENPLKIPWFLKSRFFKHFSWRNFHEKCTKNTWKMPEKCLKNPWFQNQGVFGGFQISPFVPPPFAILGLVVFWEMIVR